MSQSSIIDDVFEVNGYTSIYSISDNDIFIAQERYITPVIGTALRDALLGSSSKYSDLRSAALEPALAEYVYYTVLRRKGEAVDISRARTLLRYLSDYLEANSESFPEYDAESNILKKCNINGAFIQIH